MTTTTISTVRAAVVYGTPVAFTASVSAESGGIAPAAGSVDFYETTTGIDLGLGTFAGSTGTTSTWTLATGVKTFNVTAGDTVTATYAPGTGFAGSSGATTQTVTPLAITVTAAATTKTYDGTVSASAVPAITSGSLVAGDTAAFSETFDTRNAGTGKTLTAAGSVNDGNGGADYTLTFTKTARGQITPLAITVTAATSTKVYDGTTLSTVAPTITGGSLAPGDMVTTLAGSAAGLDFPQGVVVGSQGIIYVADCFIGVIWEISPSGVVTTLAGSAGQIGSSDGTGSAARFNEPAGLAVDNAGNVYVADSSNAEVRKITPSGVVSTLPGAGSFGSPQGVAVDSAGNVYVTDTDHDEIRKITPSGVVTTLAGAAKHSGSNDGTGSAARFFEPWGLAIDSAGNLYVADSTNDEIRKITPSGVVTTLAGSARQQGSSDGTGSAARFYYPQGVAVDSAGNVYVADTFNDEIREISPSSVVTTLAGSAGQAGSSDGTVSAARFHHPIGVAVNAAGNVFVADSFNDEIRRVTGNLVPSDTAAFTETYNTRNAGTGLTLMPAGSVNDGNGGNNYTVSFFVNATGSITARAITVTAATSTKGYDGTTSSTATPTITAGSLLSGDTAAFTETFTSRNAGAGKSLTAAGSVNDGNGGNNYAVIFTTNTGGSITARPVTVAAMPYDKVYDGTTGAAAVPTIASGSLASGDTAAFSETFDNKNVGVSKTLTAVASVNDGNGGNNYAVTFVTDTTGAIAQRPITVTATANTKVYDGTTAATAVPTIVSGSLASGDTAAFSETYDTPAAGTGKTLAPSGTVSDGNGGADYSVTFVGSATGVITQTVDHFLVNASPASVTAGNDFILTVTAEDASGNAVSGYAGTVALTSSNPLEPHPAGNLTFAPGTGLAAAMAVMETAGSWAVTAADTTNAAIHGASAPITVTAAAASQLAFSQQPSNTSAGATISPAVTVDVEDAYGNLVASSTANVTLAIASGPGALLGATTVAAAGGVASFSNLAIDQAGSYSLTASAAGVGGTAASNSFNVTAGAAEQLAFTTQPGDTPGANTMANVRVVVEDQYGNTVTTDSSSVSLTLNAAASGGGVLAGTATQSVSGGVATFGGLSIVNPSNPSYSAAGTGYSLTASDTDNGVTLATSKSATFNTTSIVTSCTMTPTGFVATFSQPFKIATTPLTIGPNLYSAAATNDLPVNVSLIGSNEGTVRGSLVVNSTDTQITFVATTLVNSAGLPIAGVSSPGATSGILAPDGYTVVLDSTSTSFVTTNGQLLDGTDSGTGGSNFNQCTAVNNSADVDVVIPSFARGPSSSTVTSAVNVLNVSTPIFATSPVSIASSAKNGATESGNTVTITTTAAHGLVAGQTVLIAGFSGQYAGYDGTFTVASVPTTTTFTYTDSTTGLGKSGGGTATGYGLTESGSTVTVWTTVANALAVGEPVTITGAAVAGYNGTFTVTSLPGGANGTTFTYTDTNVNLASSGGGTASLASGIPISLRGPTSGLTSGTFTLTYSSSDLAISGALVDPSLAASYGATLSLDASSTPGNAIIDFSTTTALPSASTTPILLGGLTATVPSTAYYKAKDLLHFSSVSLNTATGSVAAIGTDALHLVVFPGNASGSGAIASADVLDMARVVAGADAGFAAYPLVDPDVVGDLLGDGTVDGPDGALLGRYVNGVATPQMPVYPGAPVNKLSVAGTTTSVPSAAEVGVAGDTMPLTSVIDTGPLVPADATASLVAGPMATLSAGAAAKSGVVLAPQAAAPVVAVRVSQHAADSLFTALARGPVDADESAVLGSIAESTLCQGLTTQANHTASVKTDLDRLLWERGDSSWLDGDN